MILLQSIFYNYLEHQYRHLQTNIIVSQILKNPQKLVQTVQTITNEHAQMRKTLTSYEQVIANLELEKLIQHPANVAKVLVYNHLSSETIKVLASKLRSHFLDRALILAMKEDDKLKLTIICGDGYLKAGKPDAKSLVKDMASTYKINGGGQPTMATAVCDISINLDLLANFIV